MAASPTSSLLYSLLPQLLDSGVDCLHAIDRTAGMTPEGVRQEVGGRVALMGGVPSFTLVEGPEWKVALETMRTLNGAGAADGGYILSSDNSVFEGVPLANYEAMLEAKREWEDENL